MSEREDTRSGLGSDLATWRNFLEHPGWKKFAAILETQRSTRADTVMHTKLTTLEQALDQEFTKGEAAALELMLALPTTIVENLEQEIEQLNEQIQENEDATRRTSNTIDRPEPVDPKHDPFDG